VRPDRSTTLAPLRLLICDNHRVLTEALVAVVRADPGLVLAAPPMVSPAEAVERCVEPAPDVVLMDVSFEGSVDGIRGTRLIKEACPGAAVVVMTAPHDRRLMVEAMEAGPPASCRRPKAWTSSWRP
jgi:DNA-binding NarL/FixJ family response regulator